MKRYSPLIQRERPHLCKLKLDPDHTTDSRPRLVSPGTVPGNRLVEEWLAKCPSPNEVHPHENLAQKFVMIQIFERDTLLKNDLIPMSNEKENTEISIGFESERHQPETETDFQTFPIPHSSSSCKEFRRQLGHGIRLLYKGQKEVHLQRNTPLQTHYGTGSTPWTEVNSRGDWVSVFNFQDLNSEQDKLDGCSEYNKSTACDGNVVRIAVGCNPNSANIYETEFHIKLSFVAH